MDYSALLQQIAAMHEQESENAWVETAAIREAAEYIKKLERGLELYERERTRFRHTHPEMTGAYFISGESGNKDRNMLPDRIHICPAYGCDWTVQYAKTEFSSGPEW
jgi:hypothetical protein